MIEKFEGTIFQRKADGFAFVVSVLGRIWDVGEEMSKFWPDVAQVLNVMGMARHIGTEVIDINFDNIWIFAIPDTLGEEEAIQKLIAKCADLGCTSVNVVGSNNLYEKIAEFHDTDLDMAICIPKS